MGVQRVSRLWPVQPMPWRGSSERDRREHQVVEDDETGAQAYRYVKTGTNHFSFAFTYDCIAWSRDRGRPGIIAVGTKDDTFYDPILHAKF